MPAPFWTLHAERRPFLLARGRLLAALRQFFAERDFIEVETSALVVSPGNEAHLHAFATALVTPGGGREPLYLRTSPEFACKKLLAAGERRIVEFARSYRNRERGAVHHPEFTMIEWYRSEAGCETLMQDCGALLALAAETAGKKAFQFRGHRADPLAAAERLSVVDAFARYAGIALIPLLDPEAAGEFAQAARDAGVRTAADDTWGDVFSRVLVEKIEPHLGMGRATILYDYPALQSPLSRPSAVDPRLSERFELYVCGIELANACVELTDVGEQRRKLLEQMAEKERVYGERYPIDEDFLAALSVMPPAAGVALGFDRLAMLATGAQSIEQVLWTPLPQTQ
ncbi:MAG: EF-P lysine aminoacylase GenX [Hyphomicrobiales bacterium]|nr:EF-P lysine aminoacylase GenX [Hyphomicrobiales bacterium]